MHKRPRASLFVLCSLLLLFVAAGCGYKPPEALTADQKMLTLVKPAVVRPVTSISVTWQLNNQSVIQYLGSNPYKQSFTVTGSGWFISPDGYVVTNAHVSEFAHMSDKEVMQAVFPYLASDLAKKLRQSSLSSAQEDILVKSIVNYGVEKSFFVLTPGGEQLPAEIKSYGVPIGEDVSGKDVAILKVEGKNFPTLKPGNSDNVKDADQVYIIGYPGAADMQGLFDAKSILEATTSTGSIQARKNTAQGTPVIQLGGSVNPGNSGGPVVNQKGEVIGIATYKAAQGENLNFAVPMNTIQEFVRTAGANPQYSDTSKAFEEAMNLYWTGHQTKAISKFDELLRLYPAHSLAKKYAQEAQAHKKDEPIMDPTLMIGLIVVLVLIVGVVLFVLLRKKPQPAPAAYAPNGYAQGPQAQAALSQQAPPAVEPGYHPGPAIVTPAPAATPAIPAQAHPGGEIGYLHFLNGPLAGVRVPLPYTGIYVGSETAEGLLTVPDGHIAPRHCWIGLDQNGQVLVQDWNSATGTYTAAGRIERAEIQPGENVWLGGEGGIVFRYEA